ncbi:unnamed protein product [Rotaria sp. Silwood1]|nr:unnamed protein product [Rotaria sp. Silwood1]CAF0754593.1 unnamed protein product [Rotaria sp. Silwood1]CAF3337012.1 unnamed protein product [Rotaria sp. Silwood1]CAF3349936.1 unnamed protein product [Rotaria sp. Silwood1]CAF3363561.1 unnamed protein product [Rotaria sp. Silwood1]
MTKFLFLNREQIKSPILVSSSVEKIQEVSVCCPIMQQPVSAQSSPSNVLEKGLYVIINITAFSSSCSYQTSTRAGLEKDVDLIKTVFRELKFTVLQSDSQDVIIRDIVKRYVDSSTTIWVGKSRLFLIQAYRSEWSKHIPNEASKRDRTIGSSCIQLLCVMLLRYSH